MPECLLRRAPLAAAEGLARWLSCVQRRISRLIPLELRAVCRRTRAARRGGGGRGMGSRDRQAAAGAGAAAVAAAQASAPKSAPGGYCRPHLCCPLLLPLPRLLRVQRSCGANAAWATCSPWQKMGRGLQQQVQRSSWASGCPGFESGFKVEPAQLSPAHCMPV